MPGPCRFARATGSSRKRRQALGGDNRTGCAVLVTLVATLLKREPAAPAADVPVHVREESGCSGPAPRPGDLGGPAMGFNFDGRSAADITIGAVGADRWEVETFAARRRTPGVSPERGISATLMRGLAMAGGIQRRLVRQGGEERPGRDEQRRQHRRRERQECRRGDQRRDRLRPRSAASRAATTPSSSGRSRPPTRRRSRTRHRVKDHEGGPAKVKFTVPARLLPVPAEGGLSVVAHAKPP